jgi:threonine dehydrogenase-like Zn-dependent dehydrogenase
MQAILLRRGAKEVELAEVPDPICRDGQVLIESLETGICGTDREMIQRQLVDVPAGQDYLVLGHEGLGRVVETWAQSGTLKVGDLVVPIVRRGCEKCNACNSGHVDYCYSGEYSERGIHKQDGFFSTYYADWPRYLVKVEPELEDLAVLAEPLSVTIKASQIGMSFLCRVKFGGYYSQPGKRERALVAGHGAIGILGMLLLLEKGFEVYVLGRRKSGDFQRSLIEQLGVTYLDATTDETAELVGREGGFLLILEATGLSEITFQLANYLGRNGTMVLTGVPRGPKTFQIDGNTLMTNIVRTNQAIVGSVNACAGCFSKALEHLAVFKQKYPQLMSKIITARYEPEQFEKPFTQKDRDGIKVVIDFRK